jgi:hypothetical protein
LQQEKEKQLVIDVQKVQYGKSETRRSISNVLDHVLSEYAFTSLPELNAVLRQYNVLADAGKENSRIHRTGGLTYRILDESGQKVGVPVKASALHNKPTLKMLEIKFQMNAERRELHRRQLRSRIDWIMHNQKGTIADLINRLAKDDINLVVRQNDEGRVYGLTYVDTRNKVVFNGSDLGKAYSANQVMAGLEATPEPGQERQHENINNKSREMQREMAHPSPHKTNESTIIQTLFDTGEMTGHNSELSHDSRKRKKKKHR